MTDSKGRISIFNASRNNDLIRVQQLYAKGCDLDPQDFRGITPCYLAAANGRAEMLEFLLSIGADADGGEYLYAPLHAAVYYGHLEAVQILLAHGANINKEDVTKSTPFYTACMAGNLSFAELLHAHGCNWRQPNSRGRTPLWIAAYFGHYDIVQFLVSLGADLNEHDNKGESPLYAGAKEGHLKIIDFLVLSGANIDQRTTHGFTPFYAACGRNHLPVARLLYEKGCDWQTAYNGSSPLEKVTSYGLEEIVAFLKSIGA